MLNTLLVARGRKSGRLIFCRLNDAGEQISESGDQVRHFSDICIKVVIEDGIHAIKEVISKTGTGTIFHSESFGTITDEELGLITKELEARGVKIG